MVVFLFVSLFVFSGHCSDGLDDLKSFFSEDSLRLLGEAKEDRFYRGEGGVKNYYAKFHFPGNSIKSALILVVGMEDPVPLWYDTVLKAQQKGFQSVYVVELRGQGQSQRISGNKQKLIHVEDFENYNRDFLAALQDIHKIQALTKQPLYMIGHSTGALVIGQSLKEIKQRLPKIQIKAMAFWTPLIRLKMSPLLDNSVVRPIVSGVEKLYQVCCGLLVGKKYGASPFATNHLTTDSEKYRLMQFLKFDQGLGSTGVSVRWALEALQASQEFRDYSFNQLDVPTLIVKAGDESVVSHDFTYQNKKISEWTLPKAKHAVHAEKDELFDELVRRTFVFFDQNQ